MQEAQVETPPDPGRATEGVAGAAPLGYGRVLQGVAAVVAPVTLLTSVAFYFGWSRVAAFDAYFGLDPGVVGYSTRDYVLDSLDPLLLPVVVVLVCLIAIGFAHALANRAHDAGRRPAAVRRLAGGSLLAGGAMFVVGALAAFAVFPFHVPYLIGTLFPAGGVVLLAHGIDLRARLRGDAPLSTGAHVLVGLFVALCLFWAAGLYAGTVGRSEAARLAAHLDELPGVALYNPSDLALPSGHGLVRDVGTHTYTGLRLLTSVGGNLVLLPDKWRQGDGSTLIVLPEAAVARVAFTPGREPAPSGSIFSASSIRPPATDTTPSPRAVRLGALVVQLTVGAKQVSVRFRNRSGQALTGALLDGELARPAQPFVTGAGASCRVRRSSFECTLDAIPPHGAATLLLGYGGARRAHGSVTPRLGGLSGRRAIQLGPG
jgi:hypothetical protein